MVGLDYLSKAIFTHGTKSFTKPSIRPGKVDSLFPISVHIYKNPATSLLPLQCAIPSYLHVILNPLFLLWFLVVFSQENIMNSSKMDHFSIINKPGSLFPINHFLDFEAGCHYSLLIIQKWMFFLTKHYRKTFQNHTQIRGHGTLKGQWPLSKMT